MEKSMGKSSGKSERKDLEKAAERIEERAAEHKASIRTHRVGTITAGGSMIVFGVLLLLNLCAGLVSYRLIFSIWPVILIGLGTELLLANIGTKQIVYDKAAVFLMICMTFLVMLMAAADVCMRTEFFYSGGF